MKRLILLLTLLLGISVTSCTKEAVYEEPKLEDGCKIITELYHSSFSYEPEQFAFGFKGEPYNTKFSVSKEEFAKYTRGDTYCNSKLKGK